MGYGRFLALGLGVGLGLMPAPGWADRPADPASLPLPPVSDPVILHRMARVLEQRLLNSPLATPLPTEAQVFRVSVNSRAQVRGYVAVNSAGRAALQTTPLRRLLQMPKGELEGLGILRVVFGPGRRVTVSPWVTGLSPRPTPVSR
ncbi:MAG: hypothetical protein IGQ88_03810 [Gloeomargaritaceae cyanobacterium C42_A2020_066]|nr:hypothetical protein [Gloeomargaritaceae cyanobacterium C42_A2020_066]